MPARSPRWTYVVVCSEQVAGVEFPLEAGKAYIQCVTVGGPDAGVAVTGPVGEEVHVGAALQ